MMYSKFACAALLAAGIAGFSALPQSAIASNCSVDEYDHNGSLMEVQICGPDGSIYISYIRPRRAIRNIGVRDGTLLFEGTVQGNGAISGAARVFSRKCGEMLYGVSGRQRGSRISLRGFKPVRDRGCNIVEDRDDTLVFTGTFAQQRPQRPEVVAPSCPRGYVFSRGNCVRRDNGQAGLPPRPRPNPAGPAASAGNWLAIAGSFGSKREADNRQAELGFDWNSMRSNRCANLARNLWITAAGPFSHRQAEGFASAAAHFGAYVKKCD